jgi:pimeloyl-ACP methyl ester carboxylesterase
MDGTPLSLYPQMTQLRSRFDVRCLQMAGDYVGEDWQEWVTAVGRLIEQERHSLPPAQPVYLCGESLGGCLALKLLQMFPHLCDRAILLNPASSFNQRWLQGVSGLMQRVPTWLYESAALGLLPFLIAQRRVLPSYRRALLQAMRSVSVASAAWRFGLLCDFDVSPRSLKQIQQPTLIVASRRDQLLPSIAEAQRLANDLPHAQIYELPESGHACLLETEVKLSQILQTTQFAEQKTLDSTVLAQPDQRVR